MALECFARTSIRGDVLDSGSDSEEGDSDGDSGGYYEDVDFPEVRSDVGYQRPGVYVARTTSGMYYVGKSLNVEERIREHAQGMGAACLAGRPLLAIIDPMTTGCDDDLESWERNETLYRMRAHGIDNVRGWMFTNRVLTDANRRDAFNQICEKFDLCRRCGRDTHFADRCFARTRDGWAGV